MSAPVALPAAFAAWCADLSSDVALELVTCGADGWPHVAHLSPGEVVIDPQGHIRLAVWAASRGGANLAESGRGCLLLAAPEGVFEIRLEVLAGLDLAGPPPLRAFHLRPQSVRDKSAPYADIVSALRFRLHDPQEAHARWAVLRAALLAAFG